MLHGLPFGSDRGTQSEPIRTNPNQPERPFDSGLIMYPAGHARNTTADLSDILKHKWNMLGEIALPNGGDAAALVDRLESMASLPSVDIGSFYDIDVAKRS